MNQHKRVFFGWMYAVVSFSILLWLFFITFQHISNEHAMKNLAESIRAQTGQLLAQGGNASFAHLESFLDRRRERDQLSSLIPEYQGSFLSKTFWKNRTNEHISAAVQAISGYDALYRGLFDRKDEMGRDNMTVIRNQRDVADLFNRAKTRVNSQADISVLEAFMAEAEQMENTIDRLSREMEGKKSTDSGNDPVERVANNIYGHYTEVLQQNKQSAQQLRNALNRLSTQQGQQLRSLVNISAEFNASTGSVQLLYEQLYPLTRNMREWTDPVRSGVDAMNTAILPGITPLSLLRQIDPLSAQTIIMMGEIANQIVVLDTEIQQLVANVISLRNIGNSFSAARTRANALRFTEQASQSSSYLQSKRAVFEPIYQRLENANNQLNRLDSGIESVRNARARNMLFDLNLRSKVMVAQMARPIVSYQDLVDRSVRDLDQLVASERAYTAEVERLRSMEFTMADLTGASVASVSAGNIPLHGQPILLLIFFGVGLANMFLVYMVLRKPKSATISRQSKVPVPKRAGRPGDIGILNTTGREKPFNTKEIAENDEVKIVSKPDVSKSVSRPVIHGHEAMEKTGNGAAPPEAEQVKAVPGTPLDLTKGQVNPEVMGSLTEDKSAVAQHDQPLRLQPRQNGLVQLPGYLKLLNGAYKGRNLLIYGSGSHENGLRVTIGRDRSGSNAHLKAGQVPAHIPLPDETKTLSRVHVEIRYHLGKLYLYNLSTSNPAMVDGYVLKEGEKVPLSDGSTIDAGYVKMQYLSQA